MPSKSLMRSLGEFCRHVAAGFSTRLPEGPATRHEVRRETEEHTRRSPEGLITLRRTTIEELELRPEQPGAAPPTGATAADPSPAEPPRPEAPGGAV